MPPARRAPLESVEVDLSQEMGPQQSMLPMQDADFEIIDPGIMADGTTVTETADGGVEVDFSPNKLNNEGAPPQDHDANLSTFLTAAEKDTIANDLIEAVEKDKESRKEWELAYINGLKLLGLKVEDRVYPFKGASGVFDPLLAEALVRTQATLRGEMLPAKGPCKTEIIGLETPELVNQAERQKTWMNYYLTKGAPEYVEDFDQMLMWLPMVGSMFKKIYMDPYKNRPVGPYIIPDNFIVNYTASSLYDAPRMTHRIPMKPRDMIWRQMTGFYEDVDLMKPDEAAATDDISETEKAIGDAQGIKKSLAREGDDRYVVLEIHTELDLVGFEHLGKDEKPSGFPLPYVVSIEYNSRKVLSIRRNWRDGDKTFQPRMRFVHYKFYPGFGFYGLGLSHFLGGYAKAATSLLRQLIDAGTLANFPGGLRVKGMRVDDSNMMVGPSQFLEIDTGGLPISQAVTTMPYKEPSAVLKELRTELVESARRLGSTTDIAVGDGRQDAPVGTTVALLEAATKVESGVLKRCYEAQGHELQMFADLFGEHLPEEPYPFKTAGGDTFIMRKDFDGSVDVIPVADPNASSSSQRMVKGTLLLQTATAFPQLHNMPATIRKFYQTQGIEDSESFLAQPQEAQPADPATENQMALMQMPLKVGPWQDDDAHVQAHMEFAAVPGIQAHISEHLANKYKKMVENILGIPLPPLGSPAMPPEIENQIAMLVAEATKSMKMELGAQGPNPAMIEMEKIRVKAAEVNAKMIEAQQKAQGRAQEAYLKALSVARQDQTKLKVAKIGAIAAMADNERPLSANTVEIVRGL
jgi:hypothetical protein